MNIRNHLISEMLIDKELNILYGLNGSGKTSALEAISVCSLSKSFNASSDSSLIQFGKNYYFCEALAVNDLNAPYFSRVKYESGSKKEINSSFGTNINARELIGEMPLVILTPDLKIISSGSPQDRRDFIDKILCQSSRKYFDNLMTLKKILKQRNNLLNKIKIEKIRAFDYLDSWTEMLVKTSSLIIHQRAAFIQSFLEQFKETYKIISEAREPVNLIYQPNNFKEHFNLENLDEISDYLNRLSEKLKNEEINRGLTLFGPQKDELQISINSGLARETASQGQHKTLLISLKFAEFEYLKNERQETPIVLLDDIFSELDPDRVRKVFELLAHHNAQTFITITDALYLEKVMGKNDFSFFLVDCGTIKKTN